MGIWIASPKIDPGETVSFQTGANFFKGHRQIGGRITVTDKRFFFVPNRLDKFLGSSSIVVPRADIASTKVEEPGMTAAKRGGLSAAVRRQLRLESTAGTSVFTVADLDGLTEALSK